MVGFFQRESEPPFDIAGLIPPNLGSRIKYGAIIFGLIGLVALLNFLRSIYTDWLWFGELGFRSVFLKVLVTRVELFFAAAIVFAVPAGISLYFAHRLSGGPEEAPLPRGIRDLLRRLIVWGSVATVLVLSGIFGAIAASRWEMFLRFQNSVSFGTTDPVFNKDVSFYVFNLPVYEFIQGWLLGGAAAILAATLVLYFVQFSFRGVGFLITPSLRVHVSIIAAAIMLVVGLGHWLDRWSLLMSDQGAVFGAAYTDLNARKPALFIMTIIASASAVLILINAYMRGIRLLVGGVILWIVMLFVLGTAWPNAMQRLTVSPNEFAREMQYIERNVASTREAFGLADIAEQPYPVEPTLTAELLSQNLQTVDNIRLWDQGPLSSVYRQIQQIRPYYDFADADVDRYVVDGKYRQVMLAAREVDIEKLDDEEYQRWVNKKLRYTHGFGIAMSPVTEFTSEGRPEFFAKDIPVDGTIAIQSSASSTGPRTVIINPRIYYGEKTTDYVIVNTNTEELDYQVEGGELRSINYDGTGGVPIGSFLQRIAYAWQFGDINLLPGITREITGNSRIQYRREVQERVMSVAPFLRLDADPYIVAADGRLVWVQDAYTLSNRYPYSEPNIEGFNYIRNSVKVTVDAYHGTLKFYVADPTDPIIRAYQKIFPKLFVSLDEMTPYLRSHIRYPQDLFGFQAGKFLKYHMQNPQDFYNLEDLWSIPAEKFGQGAELQPVDPYYVIMKIPGEVREEFVLLLPYTRNKPPILAGWLAARSDGDNYGKLVAFNFPKERQVDSPEQIEAKIDNDPYISQWFTLRCQQGSSCIRGNLLVIPVADEDTFGLLYAEPVYLQAEGVDFPELKQVILATGEKVVMEASVPEAVKALTGSVLTRPAEDGQLPAEAAPATPEGPAEQLRKGLQSVVEGLGKMKDDLAALEDALNALKELAGEQ